MNALSVTDAPPSLEGVQLVNRHPLNPLVTPADVTPSHPELEVLCAFNPGATLYQGRPLLLVRVSERPVAEPGYVSTAVLDELSGKIRVLRFREDDPKLVSTDPRFFHYDGVTYLTSIGHFRRADPTPEGGMGIAERPTLLPAGPYECFGIEDARITALGDRYLVTYTAVSPYGVATALAETRDFVEFQRRGLIFGPDNKDIAIFPEPVGGRYVAFHRPALKHLGELSIWLASSDNLLDWGRHEYVAGPRRGMWDCERVGAGAAPIRTPRGWLELYHASDSRTRYCTGALLLDLEQPWKVLARSREPFLFPEAPYETAGFLPNIIFHSGLVDHSDGRLSLYYGAADESTCVAEVRVEEILATLD